MKVEFIKNEDFVITKSGIVIDDKSCIKKIKQAIKENYQQVPVQIKKGIKANKIIEYVNHKLNYYNINSQVIDNIKSRSIFKKKIINEFHNLGIPEKKIYEFIDWLFENHFSKNKKFYFKHLYEYIEFWNQKKKKKVILEYD